MISSNIFVYRDEFFRLDLVQWEGKFVTELFAEYAQQVVVRKWSHEPTEPTIATVRKACDEYIEKLVEDSIHASGDVLCEACDQPLRTHPYFRGAWAFGNEGHYLRRRCDGKLVKL